MSCRNYIISKFLNSKFLGDRRLFLLGRGSNRVGNMPLLFLLGVSDGCLGLTSLEDITGLCSTVLLPGIPHFLGLEVHAQSSCV